MTGIERLGTYVPRYTITAEAVTDAWGQFHGAGISRTAVPEADEDTLTMAYEAATRALDGSETTDEEIAALFVATTTPPTEEDPMGPRLVSMLGLDSDTTARQFTGSTRAGVSAVVSALDVAGPVLVVASDAPRGDPDSETDHAGGGAAVAALLSASGDGSILDTAETVDAVPGARFREAGSTATTGLGITQYDRDAYLSAVADAVGELGADTGETDAIAAQAPNGKLPYRLAGPLDISTEQVGRGTVVSSVGDVGTASPLLGLAAALDDGADSAILAGYGSGSATAIQIEGEVPVVSAGESVVPPESDQEELSYSEYLRMCGEITTGEPDGGGAYVSVPSWKRTMPQRHRLEAGRCAVCGQLSFPPDGACAECGTLAEYDTVQLPGTGTIEATTVIGAGGAPPEFVEQQARSGPYTSAVVALDGPEGGTVSIPAQVVDYDDPVEVGDRVEATIRQIYTQEGVTRYGFKMRPHSDEDS